MQRVVITMLCWIVMQAMPLLGNELWRPLPIRSQQEFEQGMPGGEGEQHPHSIAGSLFHPDHIYLSHDVSGCWRSNDAGETWVKTPDEGLFLQFGQSIQVDPNDPDIVFLTVDNSYNYLAQEFEGVYRSGDGGDTWQHVLHSNVNYNSGLHRIYRSNIAYDLASCDGNNPASRWYAAFPSNGLFRSEDSGLTWEGPVSSLGGHATIYCVVAHPADGQTVFVGSSNGLLRSDDKGADLASIGDLPAGPVSSIALHPQETNTVFAVVRNIGLYKSTNSGEAFEMVMDWPATKIILNPGSPDVLYLVGLDKQSAYSHNGGTTWQAFGEATTFPGLGRENGWRRWIDGDLSGLVPNPKNAEEAVAYSRSTLFKTTDGGATWQESATGFTGNAWSWWNGAAAFDPLNADRFAFFNNDVGMRITLSGGDYFQPNTNPNAWSWYSSGLIDWIGAYAGDFQPLENSKVIVASVGNYWKTQLMRTTNNGQSWTLVTQGDDQANQNLYIAFHPHDPNVVYAGNKISKDAGKTFQPFVFPRGYALPTLVGMCRNEPDVIFAMNKSRTAILRSSDRGDSWEVYAQPGWAFKRLDDLPTFAADPVNPDLIYTLDQNYDLARFDGTNWRSLGVLDLADGHSAVNFVRTVTIDPNNPDIIYAGMFESGISCIFRSLDGGSEWEDISANLPRCGMSAMKVNPHTGELYKGSTIGTWIYPSAYEAGISDQSELPDNFSLGQNYPNPFNPTTSIEFSLARPGAIKLDVFSIKGERVRMLADKSLDAGYFAVKWDGVDDSGAQLPSGIYIYRLAVDGKIKTGKATLLH